MAVVKVRGIRKNGRITPLKRQKIVAIGEFPREHRSFDNRNKTSECADHENVDYDIKIPKQCGSFEFCGRRPREFDDNTVKQLVLNIMCQPPSDNLSDRPSLPTKIIGSQKSSVRSKIRRALNAYQNILLAKTDKRKAGSYIEVANQLKELGMWVNTEKHLGATPGVKVGDKIRYRAQLYVIGLHQQFQCGVDYMWKDGKNLATSIVDSGRYTNNMHNDILIYSGQGGCSPFDKTTCTPTDQTLARGNLALKNSREEGNDVRVILKMQLIKGSCYVYYGLFIVENFVEDRQLGNLVYKFHLRRRPGQRR